MSAVLCEKLEKVYEGPGGGVPALRGIDHQSSVKHIERGAVIELFCVSSIGSQSPSSPHPGRAFCYSPLHRVHWNQH